MTGSFRNPPDERWEAETAHNLLARASAAFANADRSRVGRGTRVVEQLDDRARHRGSKFGVPLHRWALKELPSPSPETPGWEIALLAIGTLAQEQEFGNLEKHDGRWGLCYTRQPAPMNASREQAKTMALRDAPVDARMRFLERSDAFFRQYIDLCKSRLAEPTSR